MRLSGTVSQNTVVINRLRQGGHPAPTAGSTPGKVGDRLLVVRGTNQQVQDPYRRGHSSQREPPNGDEGPTERQSQNEPAMGQRGQPNRQDGLERLPR